MATRAEMKAAKKLKAQQIASRCREIDTRCATWVKVSLGGQFKKRAKAKAA